MQIPPTDMIVRSFSAEAGRTMPDGSIKALNQDNFNKHLTRVEEVIQATAIQTLVLVVNGDDASPLGEQIGKDGKTPTVRAFEEALKDNPNCKLVVIIIKERWGLNPGSGLAVQTAVDYLLSQNTGNNIMVFSPEMDLTAETLDNAVLALDEGDYDVMGLLREGYQDRETWRIPQHTGFIGTFSHWSTKKIPLFTDGIKDIVCDGILTDKDIEEGKKMPLVAGMDDMARLLKVFKSNPKLKIGMFGKDNPIPWNVDMNDEIQRPKIYRQALVTKYYCSIIFDDQEPEVTMKEFLKRVTLI